MTNLEIEFESKIMDSLGIAQDYGSTTLARECAALSKDVAVKFAEWLLTLIEEDTMPDVCDAMGNQQPTNSDLFDYFIQNFYGK